MKKFICFNVFQCAYHLLQTFSLNLGIFGSHPTDDFIKEADVKKRRSIVILAILFDYLDDGSTPC